MERELHDVPKLEVNDNGSCNVVIDGEIIASGVKKFEYFNKSGIYAGIYNIPEIYSNEGFLKHFFVYFESGEIYHYEATDVILDNKFTVPICVMNNTICRARINGIKLEWEEVMPIDSMHRIQSRGIEKGFIIETKLSSGMFELPKYYDFYFRKIPLTMGIIRKYVWKNIFHSIVNIEMSDDELWNLPIPCADTLCEIGCFFHTIRVVKKRRSEEKRNGIMGKLSLDNYSSEKIRKMMKEAIEDKLENENDSIGLFEKMNSSDSSNMESVSDNAQYLLDKVQVHDIDFTAMNSFENMLILIYDFFYVDISERITNILFRLLYDFYRIIPWPNNKYPYNDYNKLLQEAILEDSRIEYEVHSFLSSRLNKNNLVTSLFSDEYVQSMRSKKTPNEKKYTAEGERGKRILDLYKGLRIGWILYDEKSRTLEAIAEPVFMGYIDASRVRPKKESIDKSHISEKNIKIAEVVYDICESTFKIYNSEMIPDNELFEGIKKLEDAYVDFAVIYENGETNNTFTVDFLEASSYEYYKVRSKTRKFIGTAEWHDGKYVITRIPLIPEMENTENNKIIKKAKMNPGSIKIYLENNRCIISMDKFDLNSIWILQHLFNFNVWKWENPCFAE